MRTRIVSQVNSVTNHVVDSIVFSMGAAKVEAGGIIGTSEGKVIDIFCFDKGVVQSEREYKPDIDFLREQIMDWDLKGIKFRGIIHSHINDEFLSNIDVVMARRILELNSLTAILMPIFVISEKKIIWYEVGEHHVKRIIFITNKE